jgi:hypothetical protein
MSAPAASQVSLSEKELTALGVAAFELSDGPGFGTGYR